jgi:hypothetical protein
MDANGSVAALLQVTWIGTASMQHVLAGRMQGWHEWGVYLQTTGVMIRKMADSKGKQLHGTVATGRGNEAPTARREILGKVFGCMYWHSSTAAVLDASTLGWANFPLH